MSFLERGRLGTGDPVARVQQGFPKDSAELRTSFLEE